MAKYRTIFKPCAERTYDKFPPDIRSRLKAKIDALAENPRLPDMKKLSGKMEGLSRVRVGVYRIIYKIEDDRLVVLIVEIGHRRNIYR